MDERPDNPIFQKVPDGRLLAIRNWRHRAHADDALVAVPLSAEELERYQRLKEAGRSEEAIFDELFAPPRHERVSLSLEELTHGQLLTLLRQLLDRTLPSLARMEQEDLVALTRVLCRARKGCEGFLV